MTIKLYQQDSYMKEFDATVTAVQGREVELDQTAFYPVSGGQPDDTGVISCGQDDYVMSGARKHEGKILHTVDREGLKAGDKVHGQVDWTRRYIHMRYHTASHVLSGVIYKHTNATITGNQISEDGTRIDFDLESFDRNKLKEYEAEANKVIAENHKIRISFLPREQAMKIPTVTKLAMGLPPTIKEVRIVTIEGFGEEACGGTHLSNTSEVGGLEITSSENKGKSNRRIYFSIE